MADETQFWGLAVEGYDQEGRPANVLLAGWRLDVPGGKVFHFYPVFDSREEAAEFVQIASEDGIDPVFTNLTDNIRNIRRDEIPDGHYVWSTRKGLVRWADLV
jgi:hypothetical protein